MGMDSMLTKYAKVKHGPACWKGQTGIVVEEDGDLAVILLKSKDDGPEPREYVVRMPLVCLEVAKSPV
jgi:hypothetical protein